MKKDVKKFSYDSGSFLHNLLKERLQGYEHRKEQDSMFFAVHSALYNNNHLVVEAGTGVGKSLAYLLASAYWLTEDNKRKIVVSTYTKALQSQLYDKDLPIVKSIFPTLNYTLCLGSENYICQRRLYKNNQQYLFNDDELVELTKVFEWVKTAEKGLRSEIQINNDVWSKVSREPDLCYGKNCSYFKKCFYYAARREADKANILITNHHLFFANIAANYKLLPNFETVVFDEAHEIEDVASNYLSIEVTNFKLKRLLDTIYNKQGKGIISKLEKIDKLAFYRKAIISSIRDLRTLGDNFFDVVLKKLGSDSQLRVREDYFVDDTLSQSLGDIYQNLKKLAELCEEKEDAFELKVIADRCIKIRVDLRTFLNKDIENAVYFAQHSKRTTKLAVTLINISDTLYTKVFDIYKSCIMTSATLSINSNSTQYGNFDFFKSRIGIGKCEEMLLDSPFNYRKQALLYVAKDLKEPTSKGYVDMLVNKIDKLSSIIKGKALTLFTSYVIMQGVYDKLSSQHNKIFKQGDMDNFRLIEAFKKKSNEALLFGNKTFWQGVDFPGDDLNCVIITRIPFDVPTDPVIEGRIEYIKKQGGQPFFDYQIPRAIITFKQGFGRLIRAKTDFGVVAILDSRVFTKRYGQMFIDSLPKIKVTTDIADVERFYYEKHKTNS